MKNETLNETLDLSGIPLTLKIGNPLNGAPSSPFIAQGGKAVTKGETKYSPSLNGEYLPWS